MSKHTLVATVEEGPATLNRVLSLFRQRSFAIESLSIGRTNEPGIMRLTMVVDGARSAIDQVTKQLYRARIVDVAVGSLMVEVTGPTDKVASLIELFKPYGVKEMVRTGVVAMSRGATLGKPDKADRLKLVS
jgi:acetolactate synthase I/III small subunit